MGYLWDDLRRIQELDPPYPGFISKAGFKVVSTGLRMTMTRMLGRRLDVKGDGRRVSSRKKNGFHVCVQSYNVPGCKKNLKITPFM